ncbi:MAG: adenine phosphoribosyltransferase, partial [Planctomycetota bacterium]
MHDLEQYIRSIPDFPEEGIIFRDITTLLKDADALQKTLDALCEPYEASSIDQVVGIEARGFILGGALACRLNAGFVPIRKEGKLPAEKVKQSYTLEYGTDTLEMHRDAISEGDSVLMFDDLLATGGTMSASCQMVESLGGHIAGCAFLIELDPLE